MQSKYAPTNVFLRLHRERVASEHFDIYVFFSQRTTCAKERKPQSFDAEEKRFFRIQLLHFFEANVLKSKLTNSFRYDLHESNDTLNFN